MTESREPRWADASMASPVYDGDMSDHESLSTWLSDFLDETVTVRRVRRPNAGSSNQTLLLDCGDDDSPRTLVVKMLSVISVVYGFDPAREHCILEALHHIGAPVARSFGVDTTCSTLPLPALVLDYVAGKSAPDENGRGYMASGWVKDLAPAGRRALWFAFLDALIDLHRSSTGLILPAATHGDGSTLAVVDYWRQGLADAIGDRAAPPSVCSARQTGRIVGETAAV